MGLNAKLVTVIIPTFIWPLLGVFTLIYGGDSDVYCLKSIKDSLEDPYNYLSSWNFNNTTEGFICKFAGVNCLDPDTNKVLSIQLSGVKLKGLFPQGIRNCTSLRILDLSSNKLSGPIPFDGGEWLRYVTTLDLSYNNFSGEIPLSIANCTYLSVLNLNNNQLTGSIPLELSQLDQIKSFSVANNLLSGPVPNFNHANFMQESYANNVKLCGGPMESCKEQRIDDFADYFKEGFLVGWVFFPISLVAAVMFNCVPGVHEKEMKRKKNKRKPAVPTVEGIEEGDNEISTLEKWVAKISFADLSKATDNFSEDNVLGLGKMGTVYKGTLSNGWSFSILRLHDPHRFEEQFLSELCTLGRLKHENLVPIFGFCIESQERLLVYKHMPNGSLYSWLHTMEGKAKFMDWPLRVKVAIGLARGLAWLHHCCNFFVAHLNISSMCILLDHNFEPRLLNFGRAMVMNPNDTGLSQSFMINFEFWDRDFVKKDVYNFGVVLLELITGKEPSRMENSSISYDDSLDYWIPRIWMSSSGVYDAIDRSLIGRGFDGDIFQLLKVACNCVRPFPDKRPTMLDVYKTISVVGQRYGLTDDSEKLVQTAN